MPDHNRRLHSVAGPLIPLVDVNVGAAHSRASHTDQHLVIANPWLWHILECEAGTGVLLYECFHAGVSSHGWRPNASPGEYPTAKISDIRIQKSEFRWFS